VECPWHSITGVTCCGCGSDRSSVRGRLPEDQRFEAGRAAISAAGQRLASTVVIGLAIALVVTRPLARFLVSDLSASDPLAFAGTALLLGLVSVMPSWSPTLRATRIQPATALRDE
jgi:hypothetical protein